MLYPSKQSFITRPTNVIARTHQRPTGSQARRPRQATAQPAPSVSPPIKRHATAIDALGEGRAGATVRLCDALSREGCVRGLPRRHLGRDVSKKNEPGEGFSMSSKTLGSKACARRSKRPRPYNTNRTSNLTPPPAAIGSLLLSWRMPRPGPGARLRHPLQPKGHPLRPGRPIYHADQAPRRLGLSQRSPHRGRGRKPLSARQVDDGGGLESVLDTTPTS